MPAPDMHVPLLSEEAKTTQLGYQTYDSDPLDEADDSSTPVQLQNHQQHRKSMPTAMRPKRETKQAFLRAQTVAITHEDLHSMRRDLTDLPAKNLSKAAERLKAKKNAEKLTAKQEENERMWYRKIALLWMCLAYVGLGSLFYMLEEDWDLLKALYFSFITFFTVGYGDVSPTTPASQWFTCAYAFVGIMIIASALSLLGEGLLQQHEDFILDLSEEDSQGGGVAMEVVTQEQLEADAKEKRETDFKLALWKAALVVMALVVYLVGGSLLFMQFTGWNFQEAFYFCSMTVTTIGYGDKVVEDTVTRFLSLAYVITGILVISYIMNSGSELFLSRFQTKSEERIKVKFTSNELAGLDADGDGEIDYDEFLTYMLLKLNAVDMRLINDIRASFIALDKDGDHVITMDDNESDLNQRDFLEHVFSTHTINPSKVETVKSGKKD
jgi:hypothetical protein